MTAPSDETLYALAEALLQRCRQQRLTVVTAESCTGGLVAAGLVAVPGSSDVVERGFVTYSNAAKYETLGVPWPVLLGYGAVSEATARAMCEGALRASRADLAVSVTGVAGPSGGSADKPVGLVHFAAMRRNGRQLARHRILPGDRTAIRRSSVAEAFDLLRLLLE